MFELGNKVFLVTGAAMGMGRLWALRATRAGARVVLWDINREALEATATELRALGAEVHAMVVDLADADAIHAAAARVLNEVGTVDVLINNAGIIVGSRYWEHSPAQVEASIRINLLGVMHCARAFLPGMLEKRAGRIVNIASAAGLVSNPGMSAYCGSKWGVIGWSDSLRLELEADGYRDVRVTTVTPSYIDTGMFDGVKAPRLTPVIQPADFVDRTWAAMLKGKPVLRAPFIVHFVPLLKGLLPLRVFDLVAGKWLGVYSSMASFKGRKPG